MSADKPAASTCSPALSYLAAQAGVPVWTGALVGAVAVLAGSSVQTRLGVALVDVVLAVTAGEARRTQTGEGVDAVHAGAAVKARAEEEEKI